MQIKMNPNENDLRCESRYVVKENPINVAILKSDPRSPSSIDTLELIEILTPNFRLIESINLFNNSLSAKQSIYGNLPQSVHDKICDRSPNERTNERMNQFRFNFIY